MENNCCISFHHNICSYLAFAWSRDILNRRCNQERILLLSKPFSESKQRRKHINVFFCFYNLNEALNNNSVWVWGCVPCRWRRGVIEGQPAPLARNLKGFQSIFGHSVGFCLHKNIVRVGGLHDGIMLHHTVDTWRRPWRTSNKKKKVNKLIYFTKQTRVCAQNAHQISWRVLPGHNHLISFGHPSHRLVSYRSFSSPSERCGGLQTERPGCVCVSYVCVCSSRWCRSASSSPCVSVG